MQEDTCLLCGEPEDEGKKICRICALKEIERRKNKKSSPVASIMVLLLVLAAFLFFDPFGLLSKNYDITGYKDAVLNYTVDGEKGVIVFPVYGRIKDDLSKIPRITFGRPSDAQREMKYLQNDDQLKQIRALVDEIRRRSDDPPTQARIAISLVQHIPYDWEKFRNIGSAVERYPYEVLWDGRGLCGEKAKLLVLILGELGYGTALFHWSGIHQAAGIKCSQDLDYVNSGYCFIETVRPYPPTKKPKNYGELGGRGLPDNPQTISVHGGNILDLSEEFYDARYMEATEAKGRELPEKDYYQYMALADKYGIVFDE
jgi:hypothetical protein